MITAKKTSPRFATFTGVEDVALGNGVTVRLSILPVFDGLLVGVDGGGAATFHGTPEAGDVANKLFTGENSGNVRDVIACQFGHTDESGLYLDEFCE